MWYEDLATGFILPNSQLDENLKKDFVFNYGQTILAWNIFVTAAHGCVQRKREMSGTNIDALEKAWKYHSDRAILLQFDKKFRLALEEEFETLLKKRNELVHQPIKDMNRLLTEAGLADSHPISDKDMHSLIEKQNRFRDEVQPYTKIAMDVFKSIQSEYREWKSGIVR